MSDVWYGSLNNRISERVRSKEPEIGMGVTEYMWSDREAWEIIEIKDDRHIVIRELDSKLPEGDSIFGSQNWIFSSNPDNRTKVLFKTIDKGWKERIGTRRLGTSRFVLGRADKYYDPTF